MKFSAVGLLATLTASVVAEDVLFVDQFEFIEYSEAIGTLGFTAKVVTEDEWRTMTTADFAAFKSIVLADPECGGDTGALQFLVDTKDVWGPAVQGNIVLIGTDPSFHSASGTAGATTLIDNAIRFSTAGVTPSGAPQTGLYFALSCYYNDVDSSTVDALSYFGAFTVRGDLSCYNKVHTVASSPALGTLNDADLSDWSCSVHEAFSVYPSVGVNGFQALAIAQDIIGDGSQTFGDGTIGLPYIISRGATPAACGNGIFEPKFGEECDDGNAVDGDGCSASCKCESGLPRGDGTCAPKSVTTPTPTPSGKPVPYGNSTTSAYVTTSLSVNGSTTITKTVSVTSTFGSGPYATPTCPTERIIGVEVIVYITIVEDDCGCTDSTGATSYSTSTCSTLSKPIYNTDKPGYPCYVCALSTGGYSTSPGAFITATTTSCASPPPSYTPSPPIVLRCSTCLPYTLSTCPAYTVPSTVTEMLVSAPSTAAHTHQTAETVTTSYAAVTLVSVGTASSTEATAVPSVSYVPFVGAAGQVEFGVAGMVVAGVAAVLAL